MTVTAVRSDEKVKNKEIETEAECAWPQILAVLACTLGSFIEGVIAAWTSPFMVKIVQDKKNYNISESEVTNLTLIQPITMMVTCLFLSKVCDIFGRKRVLLFISVPQVVCLMVSAYTKTIYGFYIARIFGGIASAVLWSSLPMYIGEVTSPKVRGVWGNALASSMYMGHFAINVVGSYFDITTTSYIFASLSVLFVIIFAFMPESPFFYIMTQNEEAAKKSLRFLTRKSNVNENFIQLKKDVERQISESGTWKDFITIKSNVKALTAALFLRFSQQLNGTSVFIQYTQLIFKKSGGNVSPQMSSVLYSALCIILNLTAVMFVVDKFSRKALYATSLTLSSMVLFVMASYFYVDEIIASVDISSFNWLPITAMISYQVAFSFGLGVIPTLMLGELFSASIKTKAMTVLMIVLGMGVFLSSFLFNFLSSVFGTYAPFLCFGLCSFISTILSFYIIPDTKGKSLEEIQMSLKHKHNGGVVSQPHNM